MRQIPRPGKRVWIVLASVVLIAGAIFFSRNWLYQNFQRIRVEHITRSEIHKLEAPLALLGIKDLATLDTYCDWNTLSAPYDLATDSFDPPRSSLKHDYYFDCASSAGQLADVPTIEPGKSAFRQHSIELDQALVKNGWAQHEVPDTIDWFKKISDGVDWQSDQYYTKKANGLECTLSFTTAFSTSVHESPRMAMSIICAVPAE